MILNLFSWNLKIFTKHKEQICFFCLFIFYLLFCNHSLYWCSPPLHNFPLCEHGMCLYLFDCCLTITLSNDTLHLLHLDRFIKANPSSISIFLMKLKRLDLPQLKLDCLNCQKSDIRRNSPCSSLLLWTSFCFLQVNQQKWFLLIT